MAILPNEAKLLSEDAGFFKSAGPAQHQKKRENPGGESVLSASQSTSNGTRHTGKMQKQTHFVRPRAHLKMQKQTHLMQQIRGLYVPGSPITRLPAALPSPLNTTCRAERVR
jgi:hypothetical protein